MNCNFPHEIKDAHELIEEERKHFIPMTDAQHEMVKGMTPTERSTWLDENVLTDAMVADGLKGIPCP